jgi:hypothetical protein
MFRSIWPSSSAETVAEWKLLCSVFVIFLVLSHLFQSDGPLTLCVAMTTSAACVTVGRNIRYYPFLLAILPTFKCNYCSLGVRTLFKKW